MAISTTDENGAIKCFVISPIGTSPTPLYMHAKAVFENIIEVACQLASEGGTRFRPERDDKDFHSREVMATIVEKIVGYKVVIGVLTFSRPNVYYEIAIADSASRPIPLLKRVGEEIHFDINQKYVIEYDDADLTPGREPASYGAESPQRKLAKAIMEAHKNHPRRNAFNVAKLDPLGAQSTWLNVSSQFRDIEFKDWSRMFLESGQFIFLCGYAMNDLVDPHIRNFVGRSGKKTSLRHLLELKFLAGKHIRLIIMHEDNPAIESIFENPDGPSDPEQTKLLTWALKKKIKRATEDWAELAAFFRDGKTEKTGSFEFVKVKEGIVHGRLSMTEQEALWTPYFHQWDVNSYGPALWMRERNHPLYDALKLNFRTLFLANCAKAQRASLDGLFENALDRNKGNRA